MILCKVILVLILAAACSTVFVPPSKPNYVDLEMKESSKLHTDPAFVSACKEMAGYYKDPNKNPSLKNTILISGVNNGYKDFLHNFKCFTDRLGMKFLPISLDEGIYSYIIDNNIARTYLMSDIPGRDKVAAEPSGFGGKNFNLIGCRKMEAVGAALKLGYDVVFSDVDIALLHDPINSLFIDNVDYVHSTNKGCGVRWDFSEEMEGNTGFYSVRSNPETIRTWDLTYKACSRAPLYDDQTMFWLVLRTNTNPAPKYWASCAGPGAQSKDAKSGSTPQKNTAVPAKSSSLTSATELAAATRQPGELLSCPLDSCVFSASHLRSSEALQQLTSRLQSRASKAVMVHANWMNGKELKKGALAKAGLWIARRQGGSLQQRLASAPVTHAGKMKPIVGNWTCVEPVGPLFGGRTK